MQPLKALIAVDGSTCAQIAFDLARTIRWPASSALHIVTVVESALPEYAGEGPGGPIEREGIVIGGVARDLEKLASTLDLPGVRVETHVLVGRPASAIVAEASTLDVDLIIVGSRGHGTIASMVLGSVSAEVADHAHCPVLIARRARWSRVILGVDGSRNAERAAHVVERWPVFDRTTIEAISVADVRIPWTSSLAFTGYASNVEYPDRESAIERDHLRWANRAARSLAVAAREATPSAPNGDPASTLIKAAEETNADVIVVGTRGQTGLTRLLMGSVARNVMLHAPCSVLVVKGDGR